AWFAWFAWFAWVACAASGCLFLPNQTAPIGPVATTGTKPMPRTVAVEATFVRLAEDETGIVEALWNAVDEQAIDRTLRDRLAVHGIRAGVVPAVLPEAMRTKIDSAQASPGESREPTPASEQVVVRRVLRLLPGREGRLVARAAVPELVVFEEAGGHGAERRVLGHTFRDATSELVLSARPGADGRTRVAVVPAIEHGPQRRTWKGEEGVFRLEAGQAKHLFESLRIELELPHDSLLVMGSLGDSESSVASALFREPKLADHRLVILRPLARTHDPLFDAPGQDGETVPTDGPPEGR
ncbi:MAG: hypothetical protein EBU70_14665, partial [Actinobacteria bacterium]|nr:hypothetical protein [Actinomycetota bacterium]